jgi:hypothetical protein
VIVGVPVRWVHKTKDEVAEAYANYLYLSILTLTFLFQGEMDRYQVFGARQAYKC